MNAQIKITFFLLIFITAQSKAQVLKPGFDKMEYNELMLISARTTNDEKYYSKFAKPTNYEMIYQSKPIGLDNLWDLWTNNKNTCVISVRGTTEKQESWLSNFYAAMVPAKGILKIENNNVFNYQLADDSKAAVHVGWLLSMAYLANEIIPKIKEQHQKGIKDFLIIGHSQGGAIAYLLTSHLMHLQKINEVPVDVRFKTYCSAAPKPGNLYYAYEYEAATQGGWAYNVVNAADWVPEMPVSIQTLNDFNNVNPFTNAKALIKKQKFPYNIVLKHVYNKLNKPTKKAQKNYEKYLGNMTSKIIKKYVPGFTPPKYYKSSHYVRTGATIVLMPDSAYFKQYPNDATKLFPHHFHNQYLFLLKLLVPN